MREEEEEEEEEEGRGGILLEVVIAGGVWHAVGVERRRRNACPCHSGGKSEGRDQRSALR